MSTQDRTDETTVVDVDPEGPFSAPATVKGPPLDGSSLDGSPLDGSDLDDDEDEDEEDADPSRLPLAARRALTTLLTSRFVTRARSRNVWDTILAYEDELRERLSDLFLNLVIDREYEVAFKRQDPREDAPKILRRDKPISRDATLLLLNLRKEHMYADAVDGTVVIARTQAAEFLRPFREDGDADEARFDRRVDTALRVLIDLRLLTPDADADYLYLVSPAVVPLVGVEEVLRLEQYFRAAADSAELVADDEPTAEAPSENADPAAAVDSDAPDVVGDEAASTGAASTEAVSDEAIGDESVEDEAAAEPPVVEAATPAPAEEPLMFSLDEPGRDQA